MASLNVYEMVTERIIKQLEQGTIPWQKPWLQVLRNDNKFIVSASSKAEKAVNYILGIE